MITAGDASIPADGAESTRRAADAALPDNGQVLLLEDDPAFRKFLADCLAENGYTVVAVQNSQEGLKEVLTKDFALVLYDPMMAGLPGDLFYNAVNRVDRGLCERFVFMTNDCNDARTTDFIKNIEGAVLRKPFGVENLLDLIAFAQARGTFHRVPEGSRGDEILSTDFQAADDSPAGGISRPQTSTVVEGAANSISTVPLHERRVQDDLRPRSPIQSAGSSPKGIAYRVPAIEPRYSHQPGAARAEPSRMRPASEPGNRASRVSSGLAPAARPQSRGTGLAPRLLSALLTRNQFTLVGLPIVAVIAAIGWKIATPPLSLPPPAVKDVAPVGLVAAIAESKVGPSQVNTPILTPGAEPTVMVLDQRGLNTLRPKEANGTTLPASVSLKAGEIFEDERTRVVPLKPFTVKLPSEGSEVHDLPVAALSSADQGYKGNFRSGPRTLATPGSALDLTPQSKFAPPSFRLLEGAKIPIVVFPDGPRRVEWQPPAGWELRGDAKLLTLRAPGGNRAGMQIRIIPHKAAMAPESIAARDDLQDWAKSFLPADATRITFVSELPSPFLLGGLPSRELTFSYNSLAQDFTTSIALIDLDEESSIAVLISARTADFTPIHTEGTESMFRWNWIGPQPDRIARSAPGSADSASSGVAEVDSPRSR